MSSFTPHRPTPAGATVVVRPQLLTADITLALGCLGLVVACALSPAHINDGPVICPFRNLTGLPCPGCGLTRSWVYLTHGWWGHATAANALGVVLALALVVLSVVHVSRRLRGSSGVDVMALVSARTTIALLWAPWLLFAIGRMAWYGFTGATY
ncbi:MAG: DUF2752 domain-containing protein [Thermoleophilia bacterium]|nr:DUF2752 domain-containing protein [Thermoleophilia bacterium]